MEKLVNVSCVDEDVKSCNWKYESLEGKASGNLEHDKWLPNNCRNLFKLHFKTNFQELTIHQFPL